MTNHNYILADLSKETDRSSHNNAEYLVCCKIQSLIAKQYLKNEFDIDCDKPEVMKKSRGYVFLCPTTSGKIVIK